jgi:hypothetical protein
MKCPECGKFLREVKADVDIEKNILRVVGTCVKHGEVEPTDWSYEDFFPWEPEERTLS